MYLITTSRNGLVRPKMPDIYGGCFIYFPFCTLRPNVNNYFELGVGGEGQDTSQHFEGSFGSIRVRPRSKN